MISNSFVSRRDFFDDEAAKALRAISSQRFARLTYEHVELPLKRKAIQKLEDWREKRIEENSVRLLPPKGDTNTRSAV